MTMKTRTPRSQRYNPANEDFYKEEFPFYWLYQVHGRYTVAIEKALKTVNIDVPRWRILFTLKEEGTCSVSQIASFVIIKMPTMTKIIQRMKEEGLVDTRMRKDDGRVTEVMMTDKGIQTVEEIRHATKDLFQQCFKGMSEAKINRLNKLLEQLFNNLPAH